MAREHPGKRSDPRKLMKEREAIRRDYYLRAGNKPVSRFDEMISRIGEFMDVQRTKRFLKRHKPQAGGRVTDFGEPPRTI